jgi:DNA repair exonuclease SbcCD ATPase subunit
LFLNDFAGAVVFCVL